MLQELRAGGLRGSGYWPMKSRSARRQSSAAVEEPVLDRDIEEQFVLPRWYRRVFGEQGPGRRLDRETVLFGKIRGNHK